MYAYVVMSALYCCRLKRVGSRCSESSSGIGTPPGPIGWEMSVVISGLTCGIIAAELDFGAHLGCAASSGERLRTAVSAVI